MTDASGKPPAAIYCRISTAAMGDKTKVEDQERQCREVCKRRGWEAVQVFTDNSRSAWQRNRKRPGWDALLDGIKTGRFAALVSYWGDRIVRQPRDLEDLLDLRDVRRITLASVAGQYDFDNPDHRMMMRWEVARACNESDTISRRTLSAHARRREQGLVRGGGRGGRAFGFTTDGVTHVPAETALLREAAGRVLAGEGDAAIARDFRERGFRMTGGGEFTHRDIRRLLESPRYAGLMPDGVHRGAWKPVIGRETWEGVRAIFAARAARREHVAVNSPKYLLSGIALCGECGKPLVAAYRCQRPRCGKVRRSPAFLDEYVITRVIARLSHKDNPRPNVPAAPGLASEFGALARQREETEAAIGDYTGGELPLLLKRLSGIDARLAQLRDIAAGDARSRLLASHAGMTRERWDALPLDVRKSLVAATFQIIVLPTKRGPGFRTEDVKLVPLTSPVTGSGAG